MSAVSKAAKSKGRVLSKTGKAAQKGRMTEADLLSKADIKPEDVLSLEAATEGEV